VVSFPFAEDQVVLVGLAPGQLTRRELDQLPLVLREEGSGTQRAAGIPPRPRDAADVRVSSAEGARRAVLAGLGHGFLSRLSIAADLEAERLFIVKLPGTPIRRRFHAARLRSVTPTPAVKALLEILHG
jgi:DNA-binding transcriptional LysR family regulator